MKRERKKKKKKEDKKKAESWKARDIFLSANIVLYLNSSSSCAIKVRNGVSKSFRSSYFFFFLLSFPPFPFFDRLERKRERV